MEVNMPATTKEQIKIDHDNFVAAQAREANRSRLGKYSFNNVSPELYAGYMLTRIGNIKGFDADYFAEYNNLRSKEFAKGLAGDLKSYNQELKANSATKEQKQQQLKSWGIRNLTLYCAELTDAIFDKCVKKLGFSEFEGVANCSNRDYCPTVAHDLHQRCIENFADGGYASSIKDRIKELQDENPYGCYIAIVDSKGNISGSGLHQVMIAPTLDENGEFIMGEDGKPKMSVYSFNNESIKDLETYNKSGTMFNLCEFAQDNALRQVENGYLTPDMIRQYVDNARGEPFKENQRVPTIMSINEEQTDNISKILAASLNNRGRV